jgi:hypothetical protein
MRATESIQRHFGSMFVVATFLDTFSGGLASNISMTIGMAKEANGVPHFTHSSQATLPMASVLSAAQYICGRMRVTDEDSLADLLEDVRKQFEVVNQCSAADKEFALGTLEHVFALASRSAQDALKEVEADYPTSGGNFETWMDELFQRSMSYSNR